MKTRKDELGICTAADGSFGGWPPPDSGASPDISCPPNCLPKDAPGDISAATCGLSVAFCDSGLLVSASGMSATAASRKPLRHRDRPDFGGSGRRAGVLAGSAEAEIDNGSRVCSLHEKFELAKPARRALQAGGGASFKGHDEKLIRGYQRGRPARPW